MAYLSDSSSMARGSRVGRAMGAFESTSDPVAQLIAEVNRFGPKAPTGLQYVPTVYPLATGKVPADVAASAAFIYHRRAQDAVLKFGDKGSRDLLSRASVGLGNPTAFVNDNLADVTSVIKSYADANGLPASQLTIAGKITSLASSPLVIAAVGGGLLLFFMTSRRRKR